MNLLSFDTSLNKMYINLRDEKGIIENTITESTEDRYHSAFLISNICDILKKNSMKMQDINAIAVNVGPGSFTGIRACLTVAKTFSQQLNVPLVPVNSLRILSKINTTDKNSVVLMDAKKKQAYCGLFDCKSKELKEPSLVYVESIADMENKDYFFIIDSKIKEIIPSAVNFEVENYELGIYLSELAWEELQENTGKGFHYTETKPLYIQKTPVG